MGICNSGCKIQAGLVAKPDIDQSGRTPMGLASPAAQYNHFRKIWALLKSNPVGHGRNPKL